MRIARVWHYSIRVDCIMELCNQQIPLKCIPFSLKCFLCTPGSGAGQSGKLIKVSHHGLVWCPRTLPFLVESRHQNILNSIIFQYTSMANEVHLNGTNKMGYFSNDEGICIYLFRYHFVKLATIIYVASSRDVIITPSSGQILLLSSYP